MVKFPVFFQRNEGSKINQIICGILINLPVFCYGASIGWMSPMTSLLQSERSPRGTPLTDDEISWMAATTFAAAVPAVFLFGFMVDIWGRKASLMVCSAQFAGCWIIKLCSTEHWAMVLARGLAGSGLAGCYVITPLYTKEISEDCIRGAMGSLVILSQTLGNLFLYVLGDVLSYNTVLWICLTVPTVHMILFLKMPESPSFLLRQGKTEETINVLAWLRCREESDSGIQDELDQLKLEEEQEQGTSKFAIKSILTNKALFRAFRITMVLSVAREVCGTIPVLNFASYIFSLASASGNGLILSPNQQTMMLGAVQVAGSVLASSVVEKAGRKPLLFVTSLLSGVGMCCLGLWFFGRSHSINAADWIPIAALCICIFCDASGLQPVSLVVMSEMFTFQYRSTVNSIAMSTVCFFSFLQLLFFKQITNVVGIHATFFFFGGVCLVNTIYIAFLVPETKMRKVNEIYQELRDCEDVDSFIKSDVGV